MAKTTIEIKLTPNSHSIRVEGNGVDILTELTVCFLSNDELFLLIKKAVEATDHLKYTEIN